MGSSGTDIIIPVWNQAEKTLRCLETIREHSNNYRVIVIDNSSRQDEWRRVEPELSRHPHTLIRNCENEGFVRAVNMGLCLSRAPYVVLMNNDTEASPGWLELLRRPLEDNAEVGASGPLSTADDCWQGKWEARPGYELLSNQAMLAFFCTMFRREVFDRVGLLDEGFGLGLGDDDDFCDRMHRAGFRLAVVTELTIKHHHRTTFREHYTDEEIKAMQAKAWDRFSRLKQERDSCEPQS